MINTIAARGFSRRKRALIGGTVVTAASALSLIGATAANAAEFTSGHTDIVSVSCNASGVLTVDTFREDVGHIAPADIGDQSFLFDDNASPATAITVDPNGVWTVSGDEALEDEIPFIGFQYASAASAAFCPDSVSFDVSKVSGATNTGDATFVSNNSANGSTSSAAGDTSKVTVFRPGSGLGDTHQHGEWTFGGTAAGGDYTLAFQTYRDASTAPAATVVNPVHIHVQS